MTRFTRKSWALVLSTVILGALLNTSAFATNIYDPGGDEPGLYQIFNSVYCTDYSSSNELFCDRGVPEGQDWLWQAVECGATVRVTFRYANKYQSLYYEDQNGYTQILSKIEIPQGGEFHCEEFTPDSPFAFVNKTGLLKLSSVTEDNLFCRDHFVAFDATDLVAAPCITNAYMIAFEDRLIGDCDYNDLVAIVECVRPIPEPATMLMLGLGSLGLAGLRRRRNA